MNDHTLSSKRLVQKLKLKGITDERILIAFEQIPRHFFIPREFEHKAYDDVSLPIGGGQTISAPSTVAGMLEALHLGKSDRVLEVGTGSGFQTALLVKIVSSVYSIERELRLAKEVKEKLIKAGCGTAHLRAGDGMLGWSEYAPYDAIIVSAGTDEIPEDLLKQLKTGGRMILPLKGRLNLITKGMSGFRSRELSECKFVPLLPGHTG